jgi:2-polyprenyl-3-methyl-5-hydroxy-6-metoxy-1,4-benzoquinol methylase
MAIATELVLCNQCGSSKSLVIARGTDREYFTSSDIYSIVQCQICGLIYLNPRPTVEELARIYPINYHSYILDNETGSKGSLITHMRQKSGARRFRPVMRHLTGHSKIELLDVGCGNGWMMQVFKSLDPARIETSGVEISELVCEIARERGNRVYCGRFEDVNLDRSYDVVNLTHVIEHVSDPRGVVQKAHQALNPGGLLVLETPNVGAVEWPWLKDGNWGPYHIPRHWYFYNRETVRALGESEGLKMVDWYCHPGPTHWVWTVHNISLSSTRRIARIGRNIFDPIKIFRGGLTPTMIMTTFLFVDLILKVIGRETSVMTAIFKKA